MISRPRLAHSWSAQRTLLVVLFVCGAHLCFAAEGVPPFIEGIQPYQVFQRQGKIGEIAFRAKGAGKLTADLVRTGEDKVLLHREWELTSAEPAALSIPDVPVGGEYTLRFKLGEQHGEYRHLLVGDLWIIGGQSNAVGVSYKPEPPSPAVHYYKGGKWGQGADPLFPAWFPLPPGEAYVAAWRRAGQRYYEQTGVPVGMMGWAFGGVPMSRFWDAEIKEMPDFQKLVPEHGRGATTFMFYQGESDANPQGIPVYKDRLTKMAKTIRRYADNPEMIVLIVQLSFVTEPPGKESPYVGRLRETQRQVCAEDPRAILIPALPYAHCDTVHLTREGYFALGDRIGECMTEVYKSVKVTWQGPRLVSAQFADASRQKIRVTFDSAKELKLLDMPLGAGDYGKGHRPESDWLVSDEQHRGYAEILSAKIENGQVLLDVGGCTIDTKATKLNDTAIRSPLTRTGYLKPRRVSVDGLSIVLELGEPALPGAKVSYGLMSNSLCTLVDECGRPAATFADVVVGEP